MTEQLSLLFQRIGAVEQQPAACNQLFAFTGRLPVRLELDEVDPNRPPFSGISVTARVDTGYRRIRGLPFERAFATEVK